MPVKHWQNNMAFQNIKTGTLYGVGVGPGDPELLTLKAVRILESVDLIAVPSSGGESHTAWNIVKTLVGEKPRLDCPAPMTRDRERLDAVWEDNADRVCELLKAGKNVAFITLGDPSIYSTCWYLCKHVEERGFPVEMIPGVPSFCAAAAGLHTALCEGSQLLLIVPASHERVEESLSVAANKVFMKAGRQLGALKEELRERGLLDKASLAVNCGMEGERYEPSFADADTDAGYFSIVLLKE